ncbi:uncharacterized protein [Primulina eburnea]|uniref:uncharacterized protein n=1 Tax=Primulina eburnea TaxID=1245227 RepID=UPI003C6C5775
MKVNPYTQLLKRINQYSTIRNLRLHIYINVPVDQRCYNNSSADQVAAIWVEGNDDANIPHDRDIVAHGRDVRGKNDKMVSCRDYNCYRLQIRGSNTSITTEKHQSEIRSELYQGVVDSVTNGESCRSEVGQRVVLPASFIGGPRDMRRRYLDAIAFVHKFGKPDLFNTMTCNPDWKEIRENLFEGQLAHDRLDLVSRVFRAKLLDLKDRILKKSISGHVAAYDYVTEYQKRGLPHFHMLIIPQSNYKINFLERFDSYVVDELPDKDVFPRLFGLVSQHMMHGTYGTLNLKFPCMINGKCKNHYPRPFLEHHVQRSDGYPMYRRRNDGRSVEVRNFTLNSQWVVLYNPYLLYR